MLSVPALLTLLCLLKISMRRIRLGDIILPAPLSFSVLESIVSNLGVALAKQAPESKAKGASPFHLLPDLTASTIAVKLGLAYCTSRASQFSDTVSLSEMVHTLHLEAMPFPGDLQFLKLMAELRKDDGTMSSAKRLSLGLSLADVHALRKILQPYSQMDVSTNWTASFHLCMQSFAVLEADDEAIADIAMAFIEPILLYHPDVIGLNGKVFTAFLTLAGRTDTLAEYESLLSSSGEDDASSDDKSALLKGAKNLCQEISGTDTAGLGNAVQEEKGWKLYSRAAVEAALKGIVSPATSVMGADTRTPRQVLLQKMLAESPVREVKQLPKSAELLTDLRQRFPHFKPVIDYMERSFALHSSGGQRDAQFAPILLRGPASIGKTFFSQCLAEVMGVHFEERDLSIVSDSMVLAGSTSTFKDSSPGLVFTSLSSYGQANPLILLNEVDKCGDLRHFQHRNPMSTMYSLLEKRSAKAWSDEFVGVPVDTSRVNWILTANEGFIPEPILTRVRVFDVPKPTAEQQKAVVQYIWKDLIARDFPEGSGFEGALSDDLCSFGATLSSRRLGCLLSEAAGLAVMSGRRTLELEDLKTVIESTPAPEGTSIGFI